ncbi:MAG: sel1 repeat family protein [Oscillospiraceae bacterium]|nr:sel1 repeat family protein [Oscillospiraceae bacterium]
MKKLISLLLVLMMVLSLCACGAKEEAAPAATEAPIETEAPVEVSVDEKAAEAAELFFKADYEEAYDALCDLEDSENELALQLLALCRYHGYGCEADPEGAVELLEPLAENGSCLANYLMGKASFSGVGAVQNPEKAASCYAAAIEAAGKVGDDSPLYGCAQFVLADCKGNSRGCEKDVEAAYAAAEIAVNEAGLPPFFAFELGNVLTKNAEDRQLMVNAVLGEEGLTLEDMKQYLAILKESETNEDDRKRMEKYEDVLLKLEVKDKALAMAEQAYAAARDSMQALADEGSIEALKCIGDYFYYGRGGEAVDYEKAMECYMECADFDYAPAQAQIALMYQEGQGVEVSYEQAMEWNNRAAQQGNAQGQAQIGYLYHMGLGVTQNLDEAGRWYSRAADQGDEWAAAKLKETEMTNPQLAFEFHA